MIFPVILDLGPLLQTFLAATSPIYHFPFSQTLNMGKILDLSKNAIHVKDCFSLVGFRAASYNNAIGRAFSVLFGEKKFCASWNFAIVSRFHHLRYWRWRRYDILDWNSTLMQRWSRSRGCQREFPLSKFFFKYCFQGFQRKLNVSPGFPRFSSFPHMVHCLPIWSFKGYLIELIRGDASPCQSHWSQFHL